MSHRVVRLSGSLGAEIHDLPLADAGPEEAATIRSLLLEHQVLFFPDQHLTVKQHVGFGRHFGELEGHPHLNNPFTDHPEVFELVATRGGVADEWHSDISFQESPSVMAILNMVKCPAVGGDTMWANMYKAYEELSPPLQELCEGLTALHDATPHGKPEKMTIHPVVRVHPETGRKSLFVNEHFTRRIVELSHEESDHLLNYLTRWASNTRFTVRYRWNQGTLAMWDNRCTQHFVLNDSARTTGCSGCCPVQTINEFIHKRGAHHPARDRDGRPGRGGERAALGALRASSPRRRHQPLRPPAQQVPEAQRPVPRVERQEGSRAGDVGLTAPRGVSRVGCRSPSEVATEAQG